MSNRAQKNPKRAEYEKRYRLRHKWKNERCAWERPYQLAYRRFRYYFKDLLLDCFGSESELSEEILRGRLEARTGIHPRSGTISRYLKRYAEQGQDIGIEEIEPGVYRLQKPLYQLRVTPRSKFKQKTVNIWRRIEQRLVCERSFSRNKAHAKIAEKYNVSRSTVYQRLADYPTYIRKYRQFQNSLHELIPQLYESDIDLQFSELQKRIREATGFRIYEDTLRRKMMKQKNTDRELPIEEIEPGVYRLRREK